jgi:hypothetical protein
MLTEQVTTMWTMLPALLMLFTESVDGWNLLWEPGRVFGGEILKYMMSCTPESLDFTSQTTGDLDFSSSPGTVPVFLSLLCLWVSVPGSYDSLGWFLYLASLDSCLPGKLSRLGFLFKFPMYFCTVILYNWALYRIPFPQFLNVCRLPSVSSVHLQLL